MSINITTLDELKAASISIPGPISVYVNSAELPSDKRLRTFDPTYDLEEVHHCFRELLGVIAFIDEDEVMYAIPACSIVRYILNLHHFIEDHYMKVPFIYNDVPVEDDAKWSKLLAWRFRQCTGKAC